MDRSAEAGGSWTLDIGEQRFVLCLNIDKSSKPIVHRLLSNVAHTKRKRRLSCEPPFSECNRRIANYLAESAAIGATAAESVAIVLSVAIVAAESVVIAVESVVVVVSVVSAFFWQAVAREIIAMKKNADFAKAFMILGYFDVND